MILQRVSVPYRLSARVEALLSSLPLLSLCVRSQLRNVSLACLSLSFPNRCLGQYPDSTGNEYNVDNQAVLRSS